MLGAILMLIGFLGFQTFRQGPFGRLEPLAIFYAIAGYGGAVVLIAELIWPCK